MSTDRIQKPARDVLHDFLEEHAHIKDEGELRKLFLKLLGRHPEIIDAAVDLYWNDHVEGVRRADH